MYYMIHATDHPEGPVQMARAYRNTVRPDDPFEDRQLDMFEEPMPLAFQSKTPQRLTA